MCIFVSDVLLWNHETVFIGYQGYYHVCVKYPPPPPFNNPLLTTQPHPHHPAPPGLIILCLIIFWLFGDGSSVVGIWSSSGSVLSTEWVCRKSGQSTTGSHFCGTVFFSRPHSYVPMLICACLQSSSHYVWTLHVWQWKYFDLTWLVILSLFLEDMMMSHSAALALARRPVAWSFNYFKLS